MPRMNRVTKGRAARWMLLARSGPVALVGCGSGSGAPQSSFSTKTPGGLSYALETTVQGKQIVHDHDDQSRPAERPAGGEHLAFVRPGVDRAPVADPSQEQPAIDSRRLPDDDLRPGPGRADAPGAPSAHDPVQHWRAADPGDDPPGGQAPRARRYPEGPRDQLSPPPLPHHLRDRAGLIHACVSQASSPAGSIGPSHSGGGRPGSRGNAVTGDMGRWTAIRLKEPKMDDRSIHQRIEDLVAEEERLLEERPRSHRSRARAVASRSDRARSLLGSPASAPCPARGRLGS